MPVGYAISYAVGNVKFTALGDRVLVKEDDFRSGYDCTACNKSGRVTCAACGGSGKSKVVTHAKCSDCGGAGNVACAACNGKGALLYIPENSERRPTSGEIVSLGPDCTKLSLGQSVIYSNFAGHAMDIDNIVLRILHESEIYLIVDGHLEMRRLRSKSDVTTI